MFADLCMSPGQYTVWVYHERLHMLLMMMHTLPIQTVSRHEWIYLKVQHTKSQVEVWINIVSTSRVCLFTPLHCFDML